MTKLLVFGGNGFVGGHLTARFAADGLTVVSVSRSGKVRVDIRDSAAVDTLVDEFRPDGVVNAAAISSIDYAEDNPDEAQSINALGARNVARVCGLRGIRHLFISTDAVFRGDRRESGYVEEDPTDPVNNYGRSKAEAERLVSSVYSDSVIVRVSLVLGYPVNTATGFLAGATEKWRNRAVVAVPEDEYRSPVDVATMVDAIRELIDTGARGTFHLAATEWASRYDLTRRLAETLGFDPSLVRIAEPRITGLGRVPRHRFGVLDIRKAERTLNTPMLSLKETIDRAVATRA